MTCLGEKVDSFRKTDLLRFKRTRCRDAVLNQDVSGAAGRDFELQCGPGVRPREFRFCYERGFDPTTRASDGCRRGTTLRCCRRSIGGTDSGGIRSSRGGPG